MKINLHPPGAARNENESKVTEYRKSPRNWTRSSKGRRRRALLPAGLSTHTHIYNSLVYTHNPKLREEYTCIVFALVPQLISASARFTMLTSYGVAGCPEAGVSYRTYIHSRCLVVRR